MVVFSDGSSGPCHVATLTVSAVWVSGRVEVCVFVFGSIVWAFICYSYMLLFFSQALSVAFLFMKSSI